MIFKLLSVFISLFSFVCGDCSVAKTCVDCLGTNGCSFCYGSGCLPVGSTCNSIFLKTSYNCPKNSSVAYDDGYVRNSVFPLIGATNGNTEIEILACASKMAPDAQHVQRINITCALNVTESCTVDLYSFPSKKLIAVVFHGSKTTQQYLHQAQQLLGKVPMKDIQLGGKIIEYYSSGFDSLYNRGGLKTTLMTLLSKNPGFTVLVAGHSLGGALATIMAPSIVAEGIVPSNLIQLITSGSPRVGDMSFGQAVERLLPYHFRVVNQNDQIPELPPLNLNDPTAPQHITFEVFYKNGMSKGSPFTVCQMNEDPTCRNSISSANLSAHASYFAVPIESWYRNGCTF